MTDKKLTDNEIVKALEWYVSKFKTAGFVYMDADGTHLIGTQDVLDLINRLQAENERLDKEVDRLSQVVLYNDGVTEMKVEEAKAEAYKEFEELLKTFITENNIPFTKEIEQLWIKIDDILKEKVGNIDVK